MGDLVQRYPWEPVPAEPIADTVANLQADMRYIVTHTAIITRSEHAELRMCVNTPRGQIIPRGECKFTDDTTLEFADIGMPQVGASEMTVKELVTKIWDLAANAGLELKT